MSAATFHGTLANINKSKGASRATTKVKLLVPPSQSHALSAPTTVKKSSSGSFMGIASVVLIGVAVIAVFRPWKSDPAAAALASESSHAVRSVQVDQPSPAVVGNVALPATIRPWQSTTLYARVSGYIKTWHRDFGGQVKAGEVLAEIETPELDQELAQNIALAHEAVAAATQAKAERVEAESELQVAQAQLARTEAEVALSKSQLARRVKLLKSDSISREEYDTFLRQVEARVADVAAAQSDVTRRRANLETRTAIIEVRDATARSRQSNVDRLNELQTFKKIVAPFDGVITRRTAEIGMLITAGKESLFVVEDVSRVRVQINVPQTYSMQTSPGVAAMITLPESNSPAVPGKITRIAESVDSTNRTMLAEIELNNTLHRFQPGSYAQVALATTQDAKAWTIPTNTVSMRVNGPHIAVVNDQNQIEIRPVTLGRDLGDRIVVSEGIRGNEQLVINPGDDLTNGTQVEVSNNRQSTQGIASRE